MPTLKIGTFCQILIHLPVFWKCHHQNTYASLNPHHTATSYCQGSDILNVPYLLAEYSYSLTNNITKIDQTMVSITLLFSPFQDPLLSADMDDLVIIYNRVPKTGSTSFAGIAYDLCVPNKFHVLHVNVSRNNHVLSVADQVSAQRIIKLCLCLLIINNTFNQDIISHTCVKFQEVGM